MSDQKINLAMPLRGFFGVLTFGLIAHSIRQIAKKAAIRKVGRYMGQSCIAACRHTATASAQGAIVSATAEAFWASRSAIPGQAKLNG